MNDKTTEDRCLVCGSEFKECEVVIIHDAIENYARVSLCGECISILNSYKDTIYRGIVLDVHSRKDYPIIKILD